MLKNIPVPQLHSSYTNRGLLHSRNIRFQDTEKIAILTLEHHLFHFICRTYKYQLILFSQLGRCNRSLCHIEFLTCDKLAHGGLSHEQQGG